MTEIEKQEILRNFTTVLDHLTKQIDSEQEDFMQSTMLQNMTLASADGLSIPMIPFQFVVPSTLAERQTQINHLSQTADYVRNTPASTLTDDSIRHFVESLS